MKEEFNERVQDVEIGLARCVGMVDKSQRRNVRNKGWIETNKSRNEHASARRISSPNNSLLDASSLTLGKTLDGQKPWSMYYGQFEIAANANGCRKTRKPLPWSLRGQAGDHSRRWAQ